MTSEPHSAVRAHHRRRNAIVVALALIGCGLIAADQGGLLLVRHIDDIGRYHGRSAAVVRIIDGDTLEIDMVDPLRELITTRVRLWGIDCPEPARAGSEAQPLANEAADFLRACVAGQPVTLWLESHRTRDAFSTVLAHVELPDGTSINEKLLEEGLARTDDHWAHSRLTRYAQLEWSARQAAVGRWKKPAS